MIFLFPDLQTVQLAIAGAHLPPAVSLAPLQVAFGADGSLSVEPELATVPRSLITALKRLGANSIKQHLPGEKLSLPSWPQILPLEREASVPDSVAAGAVLFEMPTAALGELVAEMLRLGNDRQSYRFLASAQDPQDQRVLLKVIGPPYYTLLRALDHLQTRSGAQVRAYVERASRIWVEIGYRHPLLQYLRSADHQLLLLRQPREWVALDEKPFQDIYEILDFKLPSPALGMSESPPEGKLSVPLRLVPGNAADLPELWLLDEDGFGQLDELVRDADERLMKRLRFAIAVQADGRKQVLLHVSPSKLAPPSVALPRAIAFKPYWKLPNLFLPVGARLHPTLRRDAVRGLLAPDPAEVVWLSPRTPSGFTPCSIPDNAFRPLEDWIDYVIDSGREPLTEWIQATRFDFERFVCSDEGTAPDTGPSSKSARPRARPAGEATDAGGGVEPPATGGRKKGDRNKPEPAEFAPVPAVQPPSALKIQQEQLEQSFLNVEGGLDSPERLTLWPQLAQTYAAQGNLGDASIAWLNAIWESDEPVAPLVGDWAAAELPARTASPAELARLIGMPNPAPGDVRCVVALMLHLTGEGELPEGYRPLLPEVFAFLHQNEKQLGLRAVWLVWLNLARLQGADVLALARVRDRLLQRLLEEGLNSERDLPTFLRFAGLRDSDRMRTVRDKALHLEKMAQNWVKLENDYVTEINRAYVTLIFAFGMARLGDVTLARDRIESARNVLAAKWDGRKRSPAGTVEPVHAYLFEAFRYRIEQSLAGKPHAGPLSAELLERLDKLDQEHRGTARTPSLPWYMIDRMREQSKIIDPQEKFEPYRNWMKHNDDLRQELSELPEAKKPSELQLRIERLLKEDGKGRLSVEDRLVVLTETIPIAPRVGEEFTTRLLALVAPALEAIGSNAEERLTDKICILLERALFQAAHFDRSELVQAFSDKFTGMLRSRSGAGLHQVVDLLASQCLRSMRKLGMRDEIHRLLTLMSEQLLHGKSLAQLRVAHARDWHETVRSLLQLAGGWLYFGELPRALPYLDEAHHVLFEEGELIKQLKFQDYAKLARTYATVLGLGPVDLALGRIEELFRRMAPLPNKFTTATHYSRFHLNIIEDVVLSIVSEEFALGPTARRWLDDDEYLVRRRIHADMRRHLAGAGIDSDRRTSAR